MSIHYNVVKNWPFIDEVTAYGADDCIRYALSLGIAADPFDEKELKFALEDDLRVLPTFVATVGAPGAWASHPDTGIDWMQILHGEHRMHFFGALPPSGRMLSKTRVLSIVDKGLGKGALVTTERQVSDADTGERLAQIEHVSFCRADGGYTAYELQGGAQSDEPLEALPAAPERAADEQLEMPTLCNAALRYRLNGDRNPIHALPSAWRKAGFEQPILHGLCTFGMAARGLVAFACGYAPERLASISARFSAPVFPGETLVLRAWWDGVVVNAAVDAQSLHFEVHVKERNLKVLSHGVATVRANSAKDAALKLRSA